jgi:hypothetical protein
MARRGTAVENSHLIAYAMITMPDIDMEEVQFGQLLVVLVASSVAVLGRLVALFF